MIRIFFILSILLIAGSQLQAQHFDELYNKPKGPEKSWRDSGYYFMPNLVQFVILGPAGSSSQGVFGADVTFQSTDNSGLTFSGQATFYFRPNNLPEGTNIAVGTVGLATVLLPQDLLFCPDEEMEAGMGQDDPYFPLSLFGRYERIGPDWLDPPVMIMVQLNDFVVN